MKLLLLGATGLVGSRTLEQALSDTDVSQVIAPTRRPLPRHDRLVNPVGSRLADLVPAAMRLEPEAVICALGTTRATAGSKQAFRHVDYELPIAFGKAAHAAGVERFAIVTALGASARSLSLYYRTKGEVERDIQAIGFRSLTICRPSLIGGDRKETRPAEAALVRLLRMAAPILPKKFHVSPADALAAALLRAVAS